MKISNLALMMAGILIIGGGAYQISKKPVPEAAVIQSAEKGKMILENPVDLNLSPEVNKIPSHPDLAEDIAEPDAPPDGFIKYTNEKYGFYYYHSPESSIKEYDEGSGAMTIVQENKAKMRGLQIFIVPYTGDVITEDRFHKDVPSGVRYNIEETYIGKIKVPAVTFNSYDSFLGETREVWFIYKGYLYEVTTFKGMADWFSTIMKTWRFI